MQNFEAHKKLIDYDLLPKLNIIIINKNPLALIENPIVTR